MVALIHPHRSIYRFSGKDVKPFLQGKITNDIETLAENGLLYTALLSPQGRYVVDFFLHGDPTHEDALFLDVVQHAGRDLVGLLRRYILRSDVAIEDVSDAFYVATAHEGGEADLPKDLLRDLYRDPRHSGLGYRGILPYPVREGMGADVAFYTRLCLTLGIPRTGIELVPQKTIPLEANLDELNAISFTKGCYLGQELTARTKHQGLVRKKLFPVRIEQGDPTPLDFAEGIELQDEKGEKVGLLLSAVDGLGMAQLRLEALESSMSWQGVLKESGTACCRVVYQRDTTSQR